MKSLFNYLKTFVMALAAVVAVSCDTPEEPPVGGSEIEVIEGEINVELASATFCDVQIRAAVGVENYRLHLGTNAEWKTSFDEWQNSVSSSTGVVFEFGWEGKYTGAFEGSLFEFGKNPSKPDFVPLPGVTYELAILPMVEGKNALEYTYTDIKILQFATAKAGKNGKVAPVLTLDTEKTNHRDVFVNISAPEAYLTCYEIYREHAYAEFEGDLDFIQEFLLENGQRSTDTEIVVSETALPSVKSKVYVTAISLDKDGNFGEMVVQEFLSSDFTFNESLKVILGEITCSEDGKIVYIPVSAEGGEVDHYRCAYVTNTNTWNWSLGGSVEKAEVSIGAQTSRYGTANFYYPEGSGAVDPDGREYDTLADGNIVISYPHGPYPGSEAHVVVVAMGPDGMASRAAYTKYTPTDSAFVVIEADDADYEFGMPTVTYKNVVLETKEDTGTQLYAYVNFNVELAEGTDTAWVCVAGEEYIDGRAVTTMVKALVEDGFMSCQKFTTNGVFKGDSMYAINSEESKSAIFVTWLDTNGKYHETKLLYEPVAAAQADLKAAGAI